MNTKWLNTKWLGPIVLLAALVIGDQIRINRPGHKYRLTVEVETPEGLKSASGVMAVFPDRGYSLGGQTRTKGDAVFVDLGAGKNLVALLAQTDKPVDLDGVNYLALRAYRAAGREVSFNGLSRMTGAVPMPTALTPSCSPSPIRRIPSRRTRSRLTIWRKRWAADSGSTECRWKPCRTVFGRSITADRSANR